MCAKTSANTPHSTIQVACRLFGTNLSSMLSMSIWESPLKKHFHHIITRGPRACFFRKVTRTKRRRVSWSGSSRTSQSRSSTSSGDSTSANSSLSTTVVSFIHKRTAVLVTVSCISAALQKIHTIQKTLTQENTTSARARTQIHRFYLKTRHTLFQ